MIRTILEKLERFIYRIEYKFKDFRGGIVSFYQRGKRGYSDRDLWNLDLYLATWLPEAIENFLNNNNGYPAELTEQEWKDILQKMIMGFRDYVAEEYYNIEVSDSSKEALQLFVKWFGYLWN